MRSTFASLAIALVFHLDFISAQNFVPTTSSSDFPGCGVGCNVLLQAQTLCLPPNVATTNNINYEMCFCQSSLLAAIYSTPDAVCAAECQIEADRVLLQTWYRTFCSSVSQGIDPLLSTTTAPTATQSVVVVTVTSTSTPTSSATAGANAGSASSSTSTSGQSWYATFSRDETSIANLI